MEWFRRRVITPINDLLRQGLSPHTLALSLAFGISGGIFPIPGITSVVCFLLVFVFRLNIVATQITNFLMTPLDLALFIPFIRAGDFILGSQSFSSASELLDNMKSDFFGFLSTFWVALLHGVLAWLIALPVVTFISYKILFPIMGRLSRSSGDHVA